MVEVGQDGWLLVQVLVFVLQDLATTHSHTSATISSFLSSQQQFDRKQKKKKKIVIMATPSDAYSYTPKDLLASYERLKRTEAELLERSSSDAGAMMAVDDNNNNNNNNNENNASTTTAPSDVDGGSNRAASGSVRPVPVPQSTSPTRPHRLVVAATQITGAGLPPSDLKGFCFRAEQAIEIAVQQHQATLVLLPELWSGPYFCQSQDASLLGLADDINENHNNNNVLIRRMQQLAKLHRVVLPLSVYERCNNALYNSVVMIDSDGSLLGTYRKTHIPDGTGYQEKFYFTPGDTGFKVFDTSVGKIGIAICWDQWFPEAARALALQGADVLLYPTAIGSEPQDPTLDSSDHWQRVMMGHAAANMVPVVASNRCGTEILLKDNGTEQQRITFYGRSFITNATGAKIAECPDHRLAAVSAGAGVGANHHVPPPPPPVSVVVAEIDVERNRRERLAWGLFRDRRPDLYGVLSTKDGKTN